MGGYHAAHLAKIPQADLVAICDTDTALSASLARKLRTRSMPEAAELLGHVDAVVIATPTASHFALGRLFLDAGVSCLIEKPLTSSIEDAEALIQLAEAKKAVLQVGHVERFNPAVMEAAGFIERPRFIEVNRLGPYDPRVAGIGVVMDLMIHDLDIVLFLVGEPVVRLEAFGARVLSAHEDIAKVRLHFANGCIADLSASRISLQKYRRIRIFQSDSYLSLDYAAPQLKVYRKKSAIVKSLSDIQIVTPKLAKGDPLAMELSHFLACIREKKTPLVSGRHGRDALALARDVLQQLKVQA